VHEVRRRRTLRIASLEEPRAALEPTSAPVQEV
jgi:hypothetical protein